MSVAFEEILNECITAIERGEQLETVIRRYPNHSQQLREALNMVEVLRSLPAEPSSEREEDALVAFLQQADVFASMPQAQNGNGYHPVEALPQGPVRLYEPLPSEETTTRPKRNVYQRILSVSSAAAILLGTIGLYVFLRASFALPGEAFYAVKLQIEQMQRALLNTDAEIAEFDEQLEEKRVDEIRQLIAEAETEQTLAFEGTIQLVQGTSIIVEGISVQVDDATAIEGRLIANRFAEVEGLINDDAQFVATSIKVNLLPEDLLPEPEDTPVPTETEVIVSSPQPPATQDAEEEPATVDDGTADPGAVVEDSPTLTAVPNPTFEPIRPATVVPREDQIEDLEPVEVDNE